MLGKFEQKRQRGKLVKKGKRKERDREKALQESQRKVYKEA